MVWPGRHGPPRAKLGDKSDLQLLSQLHGVCKGEGKRKGVPCVVHMCLWHVLECGLPPLKLAVRSLERADVEICPKFSHSRCAVQLVRFFFANLPIKPCGEGRRTVHNLYSQ